MERDDSRGFVAVVNCCLGGGGPATWGQPLCTSFKALESAYLGTAWRLLMLSTRV